ncbi:FxsA family protein [Umboniibacter marinipuniceus]|uniref:UPF0716 protein FxsA n=1 Tax=Umboniibacter marinipuniceus TaxID=569599 RepID=A0A3M0A331_9GAMM|nr:FxsA family protein [Umboniibacter marinipuniceus]RMA79383.1 UPF0716 protein FxsA [Umboniibacter marinipuniceus]
MHKVLFGLIAIPVVELWVLISIGAEIGALATIALCFVTAFIGVQLLRHQGFALLRQVDEKVARGEAPAGELVEGVVMAVGGGMLLFPGFVSDVVGFLLILPATRYLFIARVAKYYQSRAQFYSSSQDGVIIDAEFERNPDKNLK